MEIKASKKETRPNLNLMREKDREMVKGVFKYDELPGGVLAFSIKIYKNDPVETYTFRDGDVVTIPLGIAKHLNKNIWYPEYGYVQAREEKYNTIKIVKKIRRCSFRSLEFMDVEDLEDNGSIPSVSASSV